jgi:hypothetical protein
VLLARIPSILREILEHEIRLHPDLRLLGAESAWPARPAAASDEPHAVVLASAVAGDPSVTTTWFSRFPRARIVVVAPTDGAAELYELRRHRRALGNVSPSELVATLRRSAVRA